MKIICIMIAFVICHSEMQAPIESYTVATSLEVMRLRETTAKMLKHFWSRSFLLETTERSYRVFQAMGQMSLGYIQMF